MYNEANNRSEHMKEFTNKMAEKLGLPTEKVAEAMRSVRKEWMDQVITENPRGSSEGHYYTGRGWTNP